MKTLELGHSGIAASALCLGILPFGTKVDRSTGFAILDAYYEAGGVGTESETVLGEWMHERGNRNELVIATKVGFNRDDIGPCLSRATIERETLSAPYRLAVRERETVG